MKLWFLLALGIVYLAMWPAMIAASKRTEIEPIHILAAGLSATLGMIVVSVLIAE